MRRTQLGLSLGGLLLGGVVVIFAALLGMKVAPSYIEYYTITKAVHAIAGERRGASPVEIRKSFDQRATVDDIAVVKGSDLEVTKEGGEVVVSVAYRKEIALFANIGIYIDFAASSKGQ